jgi:hypothetical protein
MAIVFSPDAKRSTDTGWAIAPILLFSPVSTLPHNFVSIAVRVTSETMSFFSDDY